MLLLFGVSRAQHLAAALMVGPWSDFLNIPPTIYVICKQPHLHFITKIQFPAADMAVRHEGARISSGGGSRKP